VRRARLGSARFALLAAAVVASSVALPIPPARAANARANPLLGRWRSLDTARGEVGTVFEFGDAGVLVYSPAAISAMRYRIEGDTLILEGDPAGGAEPDQRQTMEWLEGGRLRLRAPEGSIELSPRGPGDTKGGNRSIVGEWTSPRSVAGQNVEAAYIFDSDGRALLILPMLTTRGRYGVDGDKIHLSVPGRWAEEGTFRIENGTLILTLPASKGPRESRYARF
jgi:hypothetical protein